MSTGMVVRVFGTKAALADVVADRICALVSDRRNKRKETVLALAAGASPESVYEELERRHTEEGLSFADCHVFCLDEYYPISPTSPHSFVFQMSGVLSGLGIPAANQHALSGDVRLEKVETTCCKYEDDIASLGGIDFLLLGIGRNGHIAFNEPCSARESRTRLVTLSEMTRQDAEMSFGPSAAVPRSALTVGIGTLLEAKEILLIATGARKAPIVERLVSGPLSEYVPASYLKNHSKFSLFLDESAAGLLKRN
jgi:glucosamine-6-phosphate deaminase